jgi:hypothetical protein
MRNIEYRFERLRGNFNLDFENKVTTSTVNEQWLRATTRAAAKMSMTSVSFITSLPYVTLEFVHSIFNI